MILFAFPDNFKKTKGMQTKLLKFACVMVS